MNLNKKPVSATFKFDSLNEWIFSIMKAYREFISVHSQSPFAVVMNAKTLEEISHLPLPRGLNGRRDVLGRFKLIWYDFMILDVLVANVPYMHFTILNDPFCSDPPRTYTLILDGAIQGLRWMRGTTLENIYGLSLKGKMPDWNELLEGVNMEQVDYTLDDFRDIDDGNVQVLIEIWEFLNDKIEYIDSSNKTYW